LEKTALVLSAGAFLGAYQAGAWKALRDRFQPDLVVGCSVGALNGWAIAGGCDADELIGEWLDPANARLMAMRFPIPPWIGIFNPQELSCKVDRLFERYRPRVPFGLTAVEIPRLRLRLIENDSVTARHLVASCSIPCGYPAVRADGRWLVDGGFLDVLPLWAAAEMGATRAVAVHAMPQMPSRLIRWTVNAFRALSSAPPIAPRLDLRVIAPLRPARRLRDFLRWDRDTIARLAGEGFDDGRADRLFDG
jgi:NTE family protein